MGVGGGGGAPGSFLTMKEAGLVEMTCTRNFHVVFTVLALTPPILVLQLSNAPDIERAYRSITRIRIANATGVMQSVLVEF